MLKNGLVLILMLLAGRNYAQQDYFVLIHADNHQPFYVLIGAKSYSSSAQGYLILSQMKEGEHVIRIGWPGKTSFEQQFKLSIVKKDLEFQLKDLGDRGWALFNPQTLELKMAEKEQGPPAGGGMSEGGVKKDDAFSRLMAGVVSDTAVMYNTYAMEQVLRDSPVVKAGAVAAGTAGTAGKAGDAPVKVNEVVGDPAVRPKDTARAAVVQDGGMTPGSLAAATDTVRAAGEGVKTGGVPAGANGAVVKAGVTGEGVKTGTTGNGAEAPAGNMAVNRTKTNTIVIDTVKAGAGGEAVKGGNAAAGTNGARAGLDTARLAVTVDSAGDLHVDANRHRDTAAGSVVATAAKGVGGVSDDGAMGAAGVPGGAAKDKTEKYDTVVRMNSPAPVLRKPGAVVKIGERRTPKVWRLVYADKGVGKKTDTIILFIPVDTAAVLGRPALEKKEMLAEKAAPAAPEKAAIEKGAPEKGAPEKRETVAEKKEAPAGAVTGGVAGNAGAATPAGEKKPGKVVLVNSDCKNFATDYDVDKLRVKMLEGGKDEDRITTAKKIFKSKCFTTKQIKALSEVFTSDGVKFRFFEAAYPFVSDDRYSELSSLLADPVYNSKFKAMTGQQ